VKKFALAIAFALMAGAGVQAATVELPAESLATTPAQAEPSAPDLAVVRTAQVVAPPIDMSELPEPEVFGMMLLGLILIGYRASRVSDEKFQ
jgi:hypothetical protein